MLPSTHRERLTHWTLSALGLVNDLGLQSRQREYRQPDGVHPVAYSALLPHFCQADPLLVELALLQSTGFGREQVPAGAVMVPRRS